LDTGKPGGTPVQQSLEDHAEHVVKLARDRHMTLATVESCTAGSLAHLLAQAEGASEAVHGGFGVYIKENKIASVGVSVDLLARHSVVSAEVALGAHAVPGRSGRCDYRDDEKIRLRHRTRKKKGTHVMLVRPPLTILEL
jgi:hypothetical protein